MCGKGEHALSGKHINASIQYVSKFGKFNLEEFIIFLSSVLLVKFQKKMFKSCIKRDLNDDDI